MAHSSPGELAARVGLSPAMQFPEGCLTAMAAMITPQSDSVRRWRAEGVSLQGSQIEGQGLRADQDFNKGVVVAIKPGRVVTETFVRQYAAMIRGGHQQIAPDRFLTGHTESEVESNLVGYNHVCDDPTLRIYVPRGGLPLAFAVTRRDVGADEELTVDYATAFLSDTQAIAACRCGSAACRGEVIPSLDWQQPEIQHNYSGEFVWFVQDKIDQLIANA